MNNGIFQALRRAYAISTLLASVLAGFPPAAAAADFSIVSPTDGAVLSSPVTLRITVTGAEVGYPTDGLDHLHVSLDGGPEVALYKNALVAIPVSPGRHTLSVELAGPTHAPLMAPKTVAFTVK